MRGRRRPPGASHGEHHVAFLCSGTAHRDEMMHGRSFNAKTGHASAAGEAGSESATCAREALPGRRQVSFTKRHFCASADVPGRRPALSEHKNRRPRRLERVSWGWGFWLKPQFGAEDRGLIPKSRHFYVRKRPKCWDIEFRFPISGYQAQESTPKLASKGF